MRKDSIFWGCIVLSCIILFVFVFTRRWMHSLPNWMYILLVKSNMILQIALGFIGLWFSVSKPVFKGFAQLYGLMLFIYAVLKLPFLQHLNQYYLVVPAIFTPLPFVVVWLIDRSFFKR